MSTDLPTLTIARLCRVLENHGTGELTLPQYRVLGLLSAGDERSTELAARLAVTKPTLTALIDGLVERGLVIRETADGDRRVVRLSITPAGRDAATTAGAGLRAVLDDVLTRCADADAVLAVLDDVRRALDARWAERAGARPAGAEQVAR
jgi:DNA-binding MarR family transcriptional regulator